MSFAPRQWQQRASDTLHINAKNGLDRALVCACPGAGKTFGGLFVAQTIAARLKATDKLVVVTPNLAIKTQWIKRAETMGIELRQVHRADELRQPTFSMGFGGLIVSYQQACADVRLLLREYVERHRPIVILDEVHHTSSSSGAREGNAWGTICEDIFAAASFKLCMTGTPFREGNNPIAFVDYNDDGEAVAQVRYSYSDAIKDGVCRPTSFYAFDGEITWRSARGNIIVASFDDKLTKKLARERLRAAFDVDCEFTATMLRAADAKLDQVRAGDGVDRNAGGLILARDVASAEAIASFMEALKGERPVVVHNKVDEAHGLIEAFSEGDQRWIIGINMLSEGVDIPRLRVGVYASNVRARLYFHQFCGRFVRVQESRREHSFVFIPNDTEILETAREIEKEVFHVLDGEPMPTPVSRIGSGRRGPRPLEVLSTNGVTETGSIYKGKFYPAGYIREHFGDVTQFRIDFPEHTDWQDVQVLDMLARMGRIAAPAAPETGAA